MSRTTARTILLMFLITTASVAADNNRKAKEALQALFQREIPEQSTLLRALWEKEGMLNLILSMDLVRDWAGLAPGMITITDDCVEGKGALRVPVEIAPGRRLRIENNFVSGHHDGFRNMMCMGIEVEDFAPYRTLRFSCKTALAGDCGLQFRLYDRTGGWIDWSIPHLDAAKDWTTVTLSVPPDIDKLVDIRRIGGIMFELKASDAPVEGVLFLDNIELAEACTEGIQANTHTRPDMSYADQPGLLHIPDAYAMKPVEFVLNMSPLELPIWENDHEATMRCLAQELQRFKGLEHEALFINPGTRKPIHDDPNYLPNLQTLLVKVARYCEAHRVPFYQMTGVEGFDFYPLEVMAAVEQAAPTMCRGFLFAESSIDTNNHVDYLISLMDYLAPKNKKVLYFQQTSYWVGIMQHTGGQPGRFIKTLQNPKYRDISCRCGRTFCRPPRVFALPRPWVSGEAA